ncbi:hypothetical protein GCM10009765_02480 [Fodinicola feengrottensis]|uniref:MurNAc-LAA domain-containing protein n=2 Tax=Fodinicola feengrottensis TaxID=435914 RepID=A0ABN2FQH0_9ACTN
MAATLCALAVATTACGSAGPPTVPVSDTTSPSASASPSTSPSPAGTPNQPLSVRPPIAGPLPASRPVIVLDPGHTPSVKAIDPASGLDVSGYENEPEMQDVFAVALLVKAKLEAAGYQVIMTKPHLRDRVNQAQRSAVANNAHAALALSIHDQAGPKGGIAFNQGNNTVYYQKVGTYRATRSGKRVYFTDRTIADISARYGQVFQQQRARAEGHSVAVRGDVGYDLGDRDLAPGNIWIVQLLSRVPWIYNEAGGNSAGISGLNAADKQRYANGLVAAVEICVPTHR